MSRGATNLEEIVKPLASREGRRSVDYSRNTFERLCEIALDEVLNYDNVDPATILGVRLP